MNAAVQLKGAVGERPKPGSRTFNDPADVKAVQQLLNKALGTVKIPPTSMGKCGFQTVQSILEFQKLWPGRPDGSVWPDPGATLKRLLRVTSPLTLNPINLGRIRYGGYLISYSTVDKGPLPEQGYKLLLVIGASHSLDVTGRKSADVMGADNLPDLLKVFESLNRWGQGVECWLELTYKNKPVAKSNKQTMRLPVKPHSGGLGVDLLDAKHVGDWTYGATDSKGRDGRYLWMEPFNGKYYFAYDGKLETDPALRGLVCITYIGAVYGIGADENVSGTWSFKNAQGKEVKIVNPNVMSAFGTQLAVHLNAKQVQMEAKKGKDIKEFVAKHPTETYMLWREGHTVLVHKGKIYEFTNAHGKAKGFHEWDAVNETSAAAEYDYGHHTWWLRQLEAPTS